MTKKKLTSKQQDELLSILKERFEKNPKRHLGIVWKQVETKLISQVEKFWSVSEMERTGGEPDIIGQDIKGGKFIFCDCSEESPKGRRSICYDREALDSRKENKPVTSAIEMATAIGIEILSEEEYKILQTLGTFDSKSSSWIKTPAQIRKLGGAIFADFRYGQVFVYHNGAESYYAVRGFRGKLLL